MSYEAIALKDAKAVWMGSRGGKARRKTFRFSIHDVAKAAGKSVAAVQKARQRGKYDPHDLWSLAEYVYTSQVPTEVL